MTPFSIARLPRIEFGAGCFAKTPELAAHYGRQALIVTGAKSFPASSRFAWLQAELKQRGIGWRHVAVNGEPSPTLVDDVVRELGGEAISVVIGIG
ncbi:MAG: iron-containing alcohol dehydrogenase, partial [Gammaproteobacteria bacterium]